MFNKTCSRQADRNMEKPTDVWGLGNSNSKKAANFPLLKIGTRKVEQRRWKPAQAVTGPYFQDCYLQGFMVPVFDALFRFCLHPYHRIDASKSQPINQTMSRGEKCSVVLIAFGY